MKRLFLMSIGIVFIMAPVAIQAQERSPLGNGNFAVKLDYIAFTDDYFSDLDRSDLYLGVEGYSKITPNVYLGGEIGSASNDMLFSGITYSYLPVELNLKYAIEATPNLVVDFGAGVSYVYFEIQHKTYWLKSAESDDWILGGQFFADLTYKIHRWSIGVHANYQITEDFEDPALGYDLDLSNWRLGVQMGIIF